MANSRTGTGNMQEDIKVSYIANIKALKTNKWKTRENKRNKDELTQMDIRVW